MASNDGPPRPVLSLLPPPFHRRHRAQPWDADPVLRVRPLLHHLALAFGGCLHHTGRRNCRLTSFKLLYFKKIIQSLEQRSPQGLFLYDYFETHLIILSNDRLILDLCSDPDSWVERSMKNQYNLSLEISDYYIKCSPARTSPFLQGLEVC